MFRPIHFITFLVLSLTAQAQTFSESNPAALGFSPERLQRVDAFLQQWVSEGKVPHAVSLVIRKGQIVHYQAYGTSDAAREEPLPKDAIWRIASQSKLITTVAVMRLYEQGKSLLEDPISRYIPAFANPKVLVSVDSATLDYKIRPAKREISIRDLLTHTAGIPYEHPLQEYTEFEVPFLSSDRLEDAVNRIATRPLLHDPGEKFTYGFNTDILGRLIEVVSGQTLDAFFREHIFAPLGMNDTYFYLPAEKADRLVTLFRKDSLKGALSVQTDSVYQNFARSTACTLYSGGGGLVSTAMDYAKICQLILNEGTFNGHRLLSPWTVRLMTRNQIGELTVWERQDKFGYGLMVMTPESRYGDQAPPGTLNWGGMYCSEYTIDPKNDLVMMVYTNVYPFAHYSEFVRKYRVLVYGALVGDSK